MATIKGNSNANTLNGTSAANSIYGYGDNDDARSATMEAITCMEAMALTSWTVDWVWIRSTAMLGTTSFISVDTRT